MTEADNYLLIQLDAVEGKITQALKGILDYKVGTVRSLTKVDLDTIQSYGYRSHQSEA